jgi:hypothetical protein
MVKEINSYMNVSGLTTGKCAKLLLGFLNGTMALYISR